MPSRKRTMPKRKPLKLFVSYPHKNSRFKDELLDHLRLLERQGLIAVWHDRGIVPDAEWERQLLGQLQQADIVLMLVSGAFLGSDYCFEKELPLAVRRFRRNECIAPWVLLHECLWKRTSLCKLRSWPEHGKVLPPDRHKREEAWSKVADMVADYVDRIGC